MYIYIYISVYFKNSIFLQANFYVFKSLLVIEVFDSVYTKNVKKNVSNCKYKNIATNFD